MTKWIDSLFLGIMILMMPLGIALSLALDNPTWLFMTGASMLVFVLS